VFPHTAGVVRVSRNARLLFGERQYIQPRRWRSVANDKSGLQYRFEINGGRQLAMFGRTRSRQCLEASEITAVARRRREPNAHSRTVPRMHTAGFVRGIARRLIERIAG